MTTETIRAEFEASMIKHGEDAGYDESDMKPVRDGEGYAESHTQAAWWAWQAGIEHAETQMNRAGRSDSEIDLPPLPEAEIDDAGAFMSDAQVMSIDSAKEYARVAVEHDRKHRGAPAVWPKHAQEIRASIGVHFMTMVGEDTPSDDDKYLVTAHDLLSAFLWWTDFAPQPAEPSSEHTGTVKCPDPSMGAHACNDKSQCWEPCGELGKSAERAKVADPVGQHIDESLSSFKEDGLDLEVDDYVRCITCDYVGLVRAGADECPECGEETLQDEPKPDDQVDGP